MSTPLQLKTCPKCGSQSSDLVGIDTGMRLILQKPNTPVLPDEVCGSCYTTLTSEVSQGVKLRLEQQAKEKNRHMVWKSRVNLIRHARLMMLQKSYSHAAVSYEKYIRVLEIAYDLKPGGLTPDVFGKSSRSKELTVIANTYWDLFRIYDANSQYRARMTLAAKKLSEFMPFSPICPDIIKKAQVFAGNAKNPDVVRAFLKDCKAAGTRCFIATAAFDEVHPVVRELREFRDRTLIGSPWGRRFVDLYYRFSPSIAAQIERSPLLRRLTQIALYPIYILLVWSHDTE